jgi:hypothetical protein
VAVAGRGRPATRLRDHGGMRRPRGTTVQRGYGREHRETREFYQKLIDAGQGRCCETICVKATRDIPPGSQWHLAHTADRLAYKGPAHCECNLSEAGHRGNPKKGAKARVIPFWRPTRDW